MNSMPPLSPARNPSVQCQSSAGDIDEVDNFATVLTIERLRVLAAVARYGSVTAAAEALHYAQASVSHHLSRLSTETGAVLVQRVGRGVRLTEAGRLLAARADEILGRVAAAEAELDALTGLRAGRVRLAAFPSALGTFVPAAVAALAAGHPGLAVSLVEAEPPEALRLLRSGNVELALGFSHGEPAPDDVRAVTLLDEPIHLVTVDGTGTALADHADARWIAGCERCRAHLVRRCAGAGFTPDIAFVTDDYVAVQNLVASGVGVGILPALALSASRHPGVHAVALPGDTRQVYAATYGTPPDPPATVALLDALRTATEDAVGGRPPLS
jgi:DNA-binding transcriptional LysR family regulator